MDLCTILSQTISPEGLQQAQHFLEQASLADFPNFLKSLSDVLVNAQNDMVARSAAGLQLKNALTSKDPDIRSQYHMRWLQLSEDIRSYIKKNVLTALGTEITRPSSAAQCVASIAIAELPHNLWPDVITLLTANVTNPQSSEIRKEAALESIGYICLDIDSDVLINQSNHILTAIVHGMRKDEPSDYVKYAATTALCNSLEFTKANFDNDPERHFIMQVVCEATQAKDLKVKVAALECLVKIMSLYYVHMEHYMAQALFAITMSAMKDQEESVCLQGIEFWSNVCDEELDLALEMADAQEQGVPPGRTSRFYALGAMTYLTPILCEILTRQEEETDDDEWNPCKAAGVCLTLMANVCEDEIIPHVLPFIQENFISADWKRRDAAIMALGSMMEGPDPDKLRPMLLQGLPMLIKLLNEDTVSVRDSTAWTIGRICENVPEVVLDAAQLPSLLEAMVREMGREPSVAANICWSITSLVTAAYEAADRDSDESDPKTFALSKYFEDIITKLLQTTERQDSNMKHLRSSAYEALMEMIKNSPKDCYLVVQKTTMIILERLNQVLHMEGHVNNHSDRSAFNEMASLLCATLQSVLRKISPEDAPQIAEPVMRALLSMLSSSGTSSSGVQEDALMAVGVLIETIGDSFLKYMEIFKPFLIAGLRNHAEFSVCSAAVGLVADLCRGLGANFLPFCDEMMQLLLENLSNSNVNRSVKPEILSCFGDIALAIGVEFKKYLDVVLAALKEASQMQGDPNDFDLMDWTYEIRENCLTAYTGIIQGLMGDSTSPNQDVQLMLPHIPHIGQFIILVASDRDSGDAATAACAGLIGDLITSFGPSITSLVENEAVGHMLMRGKKSKTNKTRTMCVWVIKEIKKIQMSQGVQ